ncbi:tRNA preQ1(34) S-adenosylmethionine ribosyltransferase-isomerase QueA [Desulfovibrio inopinatus]|uniref:tRNA preQ1(34) S-adenosylmethionine ribosyltransferase-isomerase QueA n=1 Tax=Desulfovibrio inopinatus TaxID=102109 RepID=UPI000403074A|nr:tRNA preQ1(34) S-adenosylmethionine ribosyltransferase-isomerase QueA [Desulfovibrio inopinatus]
MNEHELNAYQYHLPEELIAQTPLTKRDGSRLMVVDRGHGVVHETVFEHIAEFLPRNGVVVANNSRVMPARLLGAKSTGGKVELLLLTPLSRLTPIETSENWWQARANGLLRASKGPRPGEVIHFAPDFWLEVIERGEFGKSDVELHWQGDLQNIVDRLGHMPLPPYIRRSDTLNDKTRYQTVYAAPDKTGSVAAPTAGLHMTHDVREKLAERGIEWVDVTLHVGYGTFSPVRCHDIREHVMHNEYGEVSEQAASVLSRAKKEGRPITAIGTTSTRILEGAFARCGEIAPFSGDTNIFIRPGYQFHVVDNLVTNFHLPGSSLLIMVSALAGRDTVLQAYSHAVSSKYRFFSYGDAMLLRTKCP